MSVGSATSRSRSPSMDAESESSDDNASRSLNPAFGAFALDGSYGASNEPQPQEGDKAVCQWEHCSELFSSLEALVEHLHRVHIGAHKSSYQCLWSTCPRKGLAQTSRFALISHLRSHTGEKPFICSLPECDKSFTRSDALAKHMRQQHNMSPPPPGRGSNRKRKREVADTGDIPSSVANPGQDWSSYGLHSTRTEGHSPKASNISLTGVEEDEEQEIPPSVAALADPQTGLIMGRPPSMVKYIITKAKYQYAQREHQLLLSEYEQLRREQMMLRKKKDEVLDEVLRATFGPVDDGPPTETPALARRIGREHGAASMAVDDITDAGG